MCVCVCVCVVCVYVCVCVCVCMLSDLPAAQMQASSELPLSSSELCFASSKHDTPSVAGETHHDMPQATRCLHVCVCVCSVRV